MESPRTQETSHSSLERDNEHDQATTPAPELFAVAQGGQASPNQSVSTIYMDPELEPLETTTSDPPVQVEVVIAANEPNRIPEIPPLPSTSEMLAAHVVQVLSEPKPKSQSSFRAPAGGTGEPLYYESAPSHVRIDSRGSVHRPLPSVPGSSRSPRPRPPPQARTIGIDLGRQPSTLDSRPLDWIVPVEEREVESQPKAPRLLSVAQRLDPTLTTAKVERNTYSVKAKWTGYALNVAIGMQVLLGSLTTGVAAATSNGHQAAVATTILGIVSLIEIRGALSTIVAAYLARARGSNEPELSITRVKDLDQFIREIETFIMDHGHVITHELDEQLVDFRDRFEELLGNGNGERRLSPPV